MAVNTLSMKVSNSKNILYNFKMKRNQVIRKSSSKQPRNLGNNHDEVENSFRKYEVCRKTTVIPLITNNINDSDFVNNVNNNDANKTRNVKTTNNSLSYNPNANNKYKIEKRNLRVITNKILENDEDQNDFSISLEGENDISLIKVDDNYVENNNQIKLKAEEMIANFKPVISKVNANRNIKDLDRSDNKNLMASLEKLDNKFCMPCSSDLYTKVCQLTDNNIRVMLSKNSFVTSTQLRILKYKIYKTIKLKLVKDSITIHVEKKIKPVKNTNSNKHVLITIEFISSDNALNFLNGNELVKNFDVALFYKLKNTFVIGGSMFKDSLLNDSLGNTAVWRDFEIVGVLISYYQELADVLCDIHHCSVTEDRIVLNSKTNSKTSVLELIKEGYDLNHQRYNYKVYKQTRLKIQINGALIS